MAIAVSTVHVTIDDPEAALAFYRDALGLEVTKDLDNDGMRWITLTPSTQPGVRIVLSQPHAGRSERGREMITSLLAMGELRPMHLRTDDLEATFQRVASVPGAEVVQEPDDRFWGVRDAGVRDPAGNLLRLEQA